MALIKVELRIVAERTHYERSSLKICLFRKTNTSQVLIASKREHISKQVEWLPVVIRSVVVVLCACVCARSSLYNAARCLFSQRVACMCHWRWLNGAVLFCQRRSGRGAFATLGSQPERVSQPQMSRVSQQQVKATSSLINTESTAGLKGFPSICNLNCPFFLMQLWSIRQ